MQSKQEQKLSDYEPFLEAGMHPNKLWESCFSSFGPNNIPFQIALGKLVVDKDKMMRHVVESYFANLPPGICGVSTIIELIESGFLSIEAMWNQASWSLATNDQLQDAFFKKLNESSDILAVFSALKGLSLLYGSKPFKLEEYRAIFVKNLRKMRTWPPDDFFSSFLIFHPFFFFLSLQ